MTKEFHYTRIEFPATEKVVGASINPNVGVVGGLKSWEEEKVEATKESPVVIPESFFEALKRERPDGINWDRVDLAVAVLKGEKDAITPKPPEPEPTESQKFWRDMYRTGKLSPYQKDRPAVEWSALVDFGKKYIGHPIEFYTKSGKDIMELDMKLRGGADKEYNQLGDMSKRATRMAVMVGNIVPNIALDTVSSLIPNLIEKSLKDPLKKELKVQSDKAMQEQLASISSKDPLGKINDETQREVKKLKANIGYIHAGGRLFEVMNDKSVTAFGNTIMRHLSGEKGWFTSEASDKLNDLLTYGFGDKIEDVSNGPTIESMFRIVYQVPVIGALVEQVWTRWSNFQSTNEYSKGLLKAVYVGIGLLIGAYRDVDSLPKKSLSWKLTNAIYDSFQGVKK